VKQVGRSPFSPRWSSTARQSSVPLVDVNFGPNAKVGKDGERIRFAPHKMGEQMQATLRQVLTALPAEPQHPARGGLLSVMPPLAFGDRPRDPGRAASVSSNTQSRAAMITITAPTPAP